MKKEKNFSERVLIHYIHLHETPLLSKPNEADIILIVEKLPTENHSFECFVHGEEIAKFKKGETAFVLLVLVNWAWMNKKSENNETEIKYIKRTPTAVNSYVLRGKILEIFDDSKYDDSYNAVIDCGIFVKLRLLKDQNFKIGDYLCAEGRLDASIVRGDEKI